jgi:hypothetical protein
MHIHLPKPLHGWREFVHEVAIIVLGVVIALALEQLVERGRWLEQVHIARAALHREMAFDLGAFADRIRAEPCIQRRLTEAETRVRSVADTGSTPPTDANLQPPGRLLLVGDYDAQESAQNLAHFPPDELSALGLWYDQVRKLEQWNEEEKTAWVNLGILASARVKLGAADLAMLRRDLQTAKFLAIVTPEIDRRELDRARDLGVAPAPSRASYIRDVCARSPG